MTTPIWIIIGFFVLFDLVVIPLVLRMAVKGLWNPIGRAHPPVEPAPDAVTKRYQSFKSGVLSLGLSINVSVDDDYLHLRPSKIGKLLGLAPASVPWEAISLKKQRRSTCIVTIARKEIAGPRWCLELAPTPPESGPSEPRA